MKKLTLGMCLMAGASALALSGAAYAQEVSEDQLTDDVIVVTGSYTDSLKNSLTVKRNADNIVDAISAVEAGKFPDANIADSLQRITGVAIERSGGEGQFITVRGLGPEFNTVLVNGRTMATDNDGREFSFDVLSSEIISRAEVYKSPIARLQEGGIGATVNVITARPLDAPDGMTFNVRGAGTYDTLDESWNPEYSGVFSWNGGDFGLTGSLAFSDRSTQRDEAEINGWIFSTQGVIDGTGQSTGLPASALTTSEPIHVPRNVRFNRAEEDRKRLVGNLTAQGRLSDNLEVTVDALFSDFEIDSKINSFAAAFASPYIGVVLDENNTAISFDRPGTDFAAANPLLGVSGSQNDHIVTADNRNANSYMIGGNVKWDATDDLLITADLSMSKAERDGQDPFIVIGARPISSPRFELNAGQDIPTVSNFGVVDDPAQARAHFVNNEERTIEDEITELKLEGDWNIEKGPLQTVSFGGLLSNREKDSQFTQIAGTSRCLYCGYNLLIPVSSGLVSSFTLDSGFLSDASGNENVVRSYFDFDPFAVLDFLGQEANLRNPNRRAGLTQADADAQADVALALANGPFGALPEPGRGFNVEEQVTSLFFSTNWAGGNELPWEANLGLRVAHTETTSTGFNRQIISIAQNVGDDNLLFTFTDPAPVAVENEYTNFLPSANVKFDLRDDMVLRAAASKTVTRPTLTSLGTDNTFGGRVTSPTSSGGNPELEPFESTNYDISWEWYFDGASYFGVAGFHKEFEQFLETQTLQISRPFTDDMDNPGTLLFDDTRTRNGEEGSITGLEIAGQYILNDGTLEGLGIGGNYTYVTSNVERAAGSAAADCDYEGLSPHSFNLFGFFERGGFQGRLAYNWRDEYLRSCFGQRSRPENVEAYGQLDFQASYDLSDTFQVFASGVNILDEDTRDFSVFNNRFLRYQDTGARYTIGLRASF